MLSVVKIVTATEAWYEAGPSVRRRQAGASPGREARTSMLPVTAARRRDESFRLLVIARFLGPLTCRRRCRGSRAP